jgi:hypothetical protein
MQPVDPVTGRPRGWMVLRRREGGIALGFSLRCDGDSWRGLTERLLAVTRDIEVLTDLGALARAVAPLTSFVELRTPSAPAHREALAAARAALRVAPAYSSVVEAVGSAQGEAVVLLLLTIAGLLSPERRGALGAFSSLGSDDPALAKELANLRAQLHALATMEQEGRPDP